MQPFYKLADNYRKVLDMEDIDEQTMLDTLESFQYPIEEKAKNGIAFVRQLETYRDSVKTERERLEKIEKASDNRVKWMKKYFQTCLETMGVDKVKTPLGTISLQNNPPEVVVNDPNIVPAAFQLIKYNINKKAISAALKAGENVPGCQLSQGKSLRIR